MDAPRITDLVDDVLLKIIHECSAEDVLSLERTCKSLKTLLSEPLKPLWLSFLEELDESHAPDLPFYVPVESLSSHDLKQLVSRAIKGNKNWRSLSGPRVTRRRVIDLRNKGGLLGHIKQNSLQLREIVKILPGSRFVILLWSEGYIQCWNSEKNECIWTYPQLGGFADIKVVAFDAEYDARNDQMIFILSGYFLEPSNNDEPCFIKLIHFDLRTKRVIKSRGRSLFGPAPFLARFCGNVILFCGALNMFMEIKLERFFLLSNVDIKRETISVTEGRVVFAGNETITGVPKLFIVDAQSIFTHRRAPKFPSTSGAPTFTLSDLSDFVATAQITIDGENLSSIHLSICTPTWRHDTSTSIYVIAKMCDKHNHGLQEATRFITLKFLLGASSRRAPDLGLLSSPTPNITLVHTSGPVALPRSHPYCADDVHLLSHAGRGVLASANILHKAVRYYAFSMDTLLDGEAAPKEVLGPIVFGRERVAPGKVYMERYSGALVFASKDERTLLIQYYD
ncbi:hypothetical protein DFH11DRAFT_1861241 [Phellopilus nigrolimitatus]|nr:hypothetical protein DFH11DRAFT_1861241 [Phellopilus nigrolimitatus]